MKRSSDRILTTHAGSLPRPGDLLEMIQAKSSGRPYDQDGYTTRVRTAVREIVRKQAELGLDVVDDGEMGKPGFIPYVNERLSGFEPNKDAAGSPWSGSREVRAFPEFYEWFGRAMPSPTARAMHMVCTGPEEEYLFAIAEAMHEEYKAIVDAGFLVQIDDPHLATHYVSHPELSVDEVRGWAEVRVEALNHALRGLPRDKVRWHTCYGINIGPRVHDLELKHFVDVMLKIRAGAYSFEAANPRHEHEWRVWETVTLPDGAVLIPGTITQSTVLVEHPELVAERIVRFAKVVGRENVIAGADCGFATFAGSTEIHPSVVWAKFDALVEGARIATKQLWRRA